MLTFCKKFTPLHYFLDLPIPSSSSSHPEQENQNPNSDSGLSLISADCQRPGNILESVVLRSAKGNNMDKIFSNVGFVGNTCTESLGFESSDQMELAEDENIEKKIMVEDLLSKSILNIRSLGRCTRKSRKNDDAEDVLRSKKKKVFPPPLSTMNQENGKPNTFLKPVRKDGKLELIQVHIVHPKPLFQASREEGRLRLHFTDRKIEEEIEEIKEQQQVIESREQEQVMEAKEIKDEESDNSIRIKEFKFSLMGTNEGLMRSCHELITNQHHHHMNRSTVHAL